MDGRYIPHVMKREIVDGKEKSNDIQGAKQTRTPEFKDTADNKITPSEEYPVKLVDPKTGKPTEETEIPATKDGKPIGTYTITPATGEVVFTPNKDFTGEPDPVSVSFTGKVGVDKNGNPVTSTGTVTYQPTVKPVTPTAEGGETTKPQGETQEQEITFTAGKNTVTYLDKNDNPVEVEKSVPMNPDAYTLLGEDGQPATEVPAKKPDGTVIGTYTLNVVDGVPTAVFTPTDKTYVGPVLPVTIQGEDENGTKATAKYTPHITPVEPTAQEAESTAKQGDTQKGKPTFTAGSENSTMKPETLTLVDDSGNPVDTLPATDKNGNKVGDYTVDKTTGEVIFTPTDKSYAGAVLPARVRMQDSNGTPAETNYTPNIVPVRPQGQAAESKAPQGQTQEGTPKFTEGDVKVPIKIDETQPATFYNPVTKEPIAETEIPATKDGKEVGKYKIDPKTGTVTFTPNKDFTGTPDPVTVQAKDANGTPTTATYTPTVTPVTPTAEGDKSTGLQGKVQTGTPTFTPGNPEVPMDDEVPATFEDGSTVKTVEGVGKYEVAKDGKVTFTPEKSFTGEAPAVTVKRVDKNGTPATATYTPTVTPVTPTAEGDKSTGLQGKVQTGTPKFIPGNPEVPMDDEVPATFEDGQTTKTIDKVGTYTVAKDGTVTFTPDKSFTGEAPAVTVKRVDKNGTPATATYTPTVTPVTPTAEGVTSEGAKGQVQTGKPTFKEGNSEVPMDDEVPATFEDGSTVKTVEGIGKYEVAKDGTVTFTPEKSFTGKAPAVTVKRVDKNGTPATATYTPTVRPDTKFVVVGKDGKETELIPSKDGKQPEEKIAGYKVVKTETDEKGNTKHIYEKVTTSFKDKEGNEIPGYPTEEGTTPKKDNIPGYRFVETKTLPNGDTEHVYEKVKTSFKDKEGNEIPNDPTEDGDQPKKDIPGYRFVETKKLPNGDIEHIYEKVVTPTPKYVEGQKELPNTGTEANASLAALGLLGALSGFGLLARKKKED